MLNKQTSSFGCSSIFGSVISINQVIRRCFYCDAYLLRSDRMTFRFWCWNPIGLFCFLFSSPLVTISVQTRDKDRMKTIKCQCWWPFGLSFYLSISISYALSIFLFPVCPKNEVTNDANSKCDLNWCESKSF